MKMMSKVVGMCEEKVRWVAVRISSETRRFGTEKDGMGTIELIALTVVVVGAVVGVATVLSPGLQGLFTSLLTKVKELIGLS